MSLRAALVAVAVFLPCLCAALALEPLGTSPALPARTVGMTGDKPQKMYGIAFFDDYTCNGEPRAMIRILPHGEKCDKGSIVIEEDGRKRTFASDDAFLDGDLLIWRLYAEDDDSCAGTSTWADVNVPKSDDCMGFQFKLTMSDVEMYSGAIWWE